MRQPLTDSQLKDVLDLYAQGTGHTSCDDACEQRNYCKDALAVIKKDRQAYVAQQRQELMEEPVKLLEDALQKFSELWKMWAIDYGIDSNMEKIENYLNKLSKETK